MEKRTKINQFRFMMPKEENIFRFFVSFRSFFLDTIGRRPNKLFNFNKIQFIDLLKIILKHQFAFANDFNGRVIFTKKKSP